MEIFPSNNLVSSIGNKQVFIDNDYLSLMFENEDVFKQSLKLFTNSTIFIDPYTEFEFLRDVFIPSGRILREQFLSYNIFVPALKHQDIYLKIQQNALLLSKVYAHQNSKTKPSGIDLLLAGRLMYHKSNTCLVTGNKKDFPSCVFTTLGVVSIEKDQLSGMRSYSVIEFSAEKFDSVYGVYQEMDKKGIRELAQELK